MSTALQKVANRLSVSEEEVRDIVMNTVMPNGGQRVTTAQFTSFIAVANEYGLNPLTKEIYAFPAKGGGIQPIVSIDGWLRIINTHPDFNGMTFVDERGQDGALISITCSIHKKNTEHPVQVTEYMAECKRGTDTWKQWPSRMLRHKAAIQAARYAFGLSGIIDPDEAERFKDAGAIEVTAEPVIEYMPDERFAEAFVKWEELVLAGKRTPEQLIEFVTSKGTHLAPHQIDIIRKIGSEDAA